MHYLVKRRAQKSHHLVTRQTTSTIYAQIEKHLRDILQLINFDRAVSHLLEMILINIGLKNVEHLKPHLFQNLSANLFRRK
jgi:hypothetical protein